MIRFTLVIFAATCVFGLPKNLQFKGHGEKIIGGSEARPGQFPYQAELSLNGGQRHHCGGTILNERWILTAAHCVEEYEAEDFTIKLGSTTLNSNYTPHSLNQITPHPSYNASSKQNDLALLQTTSPIKFSPTIQPLPLSSSPPPVGSDVTASGWGYLMFETDAPIPNELQYITLKTIANHKCKVMMMGVNSVVDSQMCTLTESGEGMCGGDSGGPLVFEGKLVGVVSWGIPCGTGFPDVFVNVAVYLDWIEQNIN